MLHKYETPQDIFKRGESLPNPLTLVEHFPMMPVPNQTGEGCRCMDEFGIYRFVIDEQAATIGSVAMDVLTESSSARLKSTPALTERGLWVPYSNYEVFRFRYRRILDRAVGIQPLYDNPAKPLPAASLTPQNTNTAIFSRYHKAESSFSDNEEFAVVANRQTVSDQGDFLFHRGGAYSLVVPDSSEVDEVIPLFQVPFLNKMRPAAAGALVSFLLASAAGDIGPLHIQQDFSHQPSLFN